jgi:hypothetical protein
MPDRESSAKNRGLKIGGCQGVIRRFLRELQPPQTKFHAVIGDELLKRCDNNASFVAVSPFKRMEPCICIPLLMN